MEAGVEITRTSMPNKYSAVLGEDAMKTKTDIRLETIGKTEEDSDISGRGLLAFIIAYLVMGHYFGYIKIAYLSFCIFILTSELQDVIKGKVELRVVISTAVIFAVIYFTIFEYDPSGAIGSFINSHPAIKELLSFMKLIVVGIIFLFIVISLSTIPHIVIPIYIIILLYYR